MPQIVRPLTDISKGAAQVFDVSGVADLQREKDAKKNADMEKLMANSLNYDPSGLYREDVTVYKDMMQDYQKWIGENNEALLNPGENIDVWQEKQFKENRIKNYASGSKNKNAQFNSATQMALQDKKWNNPENTSYLVGIGSTSQDDFDKGEGFFNVFDGLARNSDTDMLKYAGLVEKQMADIGKKVKPEEAEGMPGYIKFGEDTYYSYNEEEVKALLDVFWSRKRSAEAGDLHSDYKDSEDPFQAFYEDTMALVRKRGESGESWTKKSADGKAPKGAYVAQPQLGSSQTIVETGGGITYTKDQIKQAGRTGKELSAGLGTYGAGLATVNQGYSVGEDKSKAGTTKGQVMRVDGMGLTIDLPPRGATNITTGKPILGDESHVFKKSQVTEFGNYWWAVKDVIIPIIGDKGNEIESITIETGSPIPDLQELLDNGKITKGTKDRILNKTYGNVQPGLGMVMVSDPEVTGVFGKAKGADYVETVGASESGKIFTVVPVEGYEAALNSALADLYPDLAEMYDGNTLENILAPIKLDNSYYDYWDQRPKKSGLR